MDLTDAFHKAKSLGINPHKMEKVELIRAIQKKEGHFRCFKVIIDSCPQEKCCWREKCQAPY